jgi:hypothetical protein
MRILLQGNETMRIFNASVAATALMFGILSANSSSAACIAGPYGSGLPPTTINLGSTILGYVEMQDQVLTVGSTIISPNGVYQLKVRPEGDLALYNGSQVIWSSPVQNCIPTPYFTRHTKLQSDGNLVVYYSLQNNPVPLIAAWSTGTFGNSNSRLFVQNDGNVVIRGTSDQVLWAIRR